MSTNDLLIIAAGIIVGGGLLYLLLFLWRNVLYEQKDTKLEVDAVKFISATKELSYATGNVFKLRENYKAKRYKQQEKDGILLDKDLTKIVYGE